MPLISYDHLLKMSFRYVAKLALEHAEKFGLYGAQYFFITFATGYPGVEVPDYLFNEYPEELTIVLEHQFWNLKVHEDRFEVSLSFDSKMEHLVVPFDSLLEFADPSEDFVLQFDTEAIEYAASTENFEDVFTEEEGPSSKKKKNKKETAKVVSLDDFRNK
jgi:hypothetical protein